VADGLRRSRAELIACMVCDSGKRVEEADTEVSEAIDFAEYYARSLLEFEHVATLKPRGVTVVTPPWNFPLAIPLGGALAALVAGNSVILKPAPETVLVAHCAAQVLWDAGIPRDAFQLVTTDDDTASQLITDARVATVVLTGATATALHFRALRPRLHLCAETGGKNAIIVTAFADRELAIRDTLISAFGHAGQKCSAASLLILEADLYDDQKFLEKLRNATQDLVVGSAWDPRSFITPLIRPAAGPLQRALTQLDDGESWLVEPHQSLENPQLWSPGVKLGSIEGSFSHTTECFGPVLAVMRAEDLQHAVRLANGTPYGLTAGLHSLDEQEQRYFLSNMQAGNLYLNRTVTGAIVARQPFGGRKASSVGPGLKAGGPNYIVQLMRADPALEEPDSAAATALTPSTAALLGRLAYDLNAGDQARLRQRAFEYQSAFNQFFRDPRDPSRVLGQDNWLRYQPWPVLLRVDPGATALEFATSILAAHMAAAGTDSSVALHLSVEPSLAALLPGLQLRRAERIQLAPASVAELHEYLHRHGIDRVRALGPTPDDLFAAVAPTPIHVTCEAVCAQGRIELLHYLREQSCSITTHRYGHLPREKATVV